MANFWKGFNQGSQPYIGNVGNLISDIMMYNYKQKEINQRDSDQRKVAEQKAKEKELEATRNQENFNEFVKDPVNNAHLLSQMNPSTRAASSDWLKLQPKTTYKTVETENGEELQQFTKNYLGEETYVKTLDSTPVVSETETIVEDGKTVKYNIMSDGSRVRASVKIDRTKNPTNNEQQQVQKLRDSIYSAFKYKIKADNNLDPIQSEINKG